MKPLRKVSELKNKILNLLLQTKLRSEVQNVGDDADIFKLRSEIEKENLKV